MPRNLLPVAGVLLAGGLARRIGGGDKALSMLAGETILARVIACARPQVRGLLLNANGDPERFAAFGLPVMKAVKVAGPQDVIVAERYVGVADWLLFDAKAPKSMRGALPGGNALIFDWELLAGRTWPKPWMLSGGLTAGNVDEAVRISGTEAVDVSSGVESRPGRKDPRLIAAFLEAVAGL